MGSNKITALEKSIQINDHSFTEISVEHILDHCVQRRNEVIGGFHQNRFLLEKDNSDVSLYYFDCQVAQIVKHYVIFLRNTMLEVHKANVKTISKSVPKTEWDKYIHGVKKNIDQVTFEYKESIDRKWQWIQSPENQKSTTLESNLIHSPGEVYNKQIEVCGGQMTRIKNQDNTFIEIAKKLNIIRENLKSHFDIYLTKEKDLENFLTQLNASLPDEPDVLSAIAKAKTQLSTIAISGADEIVWLKKLDDQMTNLPKIKIITGYSNGHLIEKNLDLARGTKKWIDMELIPQHIQLRDSVEQNLNRVNTMLINAQHKYRLLEGKKNKIYHDEILSTISILSTAQKTTTQHISEEYNKIINHTSTMLRADELYNDQNWMVTGYDLSLIQLKSDTENVFKKLYQNCTNYLNTAKWAPFFTDNNEINRTESIARFVQAKTKDNPTGHYQRVFMSDGFLSDYYLVNREKEMEQVSNLNELWNDGFGVSLAITGMPRSGKTTFTKQVLHKYWPDNHVFIYPNSSFVLNGNKISTTTDLDKTIDNAMNVLGIDDKICIVIDEVHLWHGNDTSLFQNMVNLRSQVLTLRPNVLIMVSIGYHLLSRLQTVTRFKEAFMSYIDISFINKKDFITTLGYRHNATQNELYDTKGEPLTPKQIDSIGSKIWKYTSRNIGTSLLEWIRSIAQDNTGRWVIDFNTYKYPVIVDESSAIMINAVLLYSSLSKDHLIDMTDHMDLNLQQSLLYSMMNSKAFLLDGNDKISVNPSVVTEIQYQYNDLDDYEHYKYLITSEYIHGDIHQIKRNIQKLFFYFPFWSHESEVSIKIINNKLYITTLTMEPPAKIVDYLNDQQREYKYQFIKRVKI
ncbi:MAG: hypothetical protein V3V00_14615 [Saprospiraceae bacterium]